MKKQDFESLVSSIRQAGAIRRGEMKPGRVTEISSTDIKEVRRRMGKAQSEFANMIGVSLSKLQDWERGLSRPEVPAMAHLKVAAESPDTVRAILDD